MSDTVAAPGLLTALLSARLGRAAPPPGAALALPVDRVVLDAEAAAEVLVGDARRAPRVRDPARFVVVAGAPLPPERRRALERTARAARLALAHDPGRAGLPGLVAAEEGLVAGGTIVVGRGADVGALGALGVLALRASPLELAALLEAPGLATAVPPSVGVRLAGRLPRWAGGFDAARAVLAALPADLRPGVLLELGGPGLSGLAVAERLALCATLASAGRASLAVHDERTRIWLAARTPRRAEPVPTDAQAMGGGEPPGSAQAATGSAVENMWIDVDLSRAAPGVVERPWPGAPVDLAAEAGRVDRALLAGRIEEFRTAAEVLRDRNVAEGCFLGLMPASQRTLLQAIEEGVLADLLRAGAVLVPPGTPPPPPAADEAVLATPLCGATRWLAGPAVVAASAVAGRLIDPESMRRAGRRAPRRR